MSSTRNRLYLLAGLLLFLMVLFSLLGFSATLFFAKRDEAQTILQLHNLLRHDEAIAPFLTQYNITPIDATQFKALQRDATPFITNAVIAQFSNDVSIQIYLHQYRVFFSIDGHYFVRNSAMYAPYLVPFSLVTLFFLAVILALVAFIRNTLKPIEQIRQNIARFEQHEALISPERTDDELQRMSFHFYRSIGDIQELHEQRNLFIRAIMHELKTPLTKARFLTHFLPQSSEKEDFERLFASMQKELDKLHDFEILNHTLQQHALQSVELASLIDEAMTTLLIEKRRVTVTCKSVIVQAHAPSLFIVIKNLLDNAHKYGAGGAIDINANQQRLCISNAGEQPLDFEQLCEPFTQASSKHSGMGVGLYLIVRICKQYNWQLKYHFMQNRHHICLQFSGVNQT